MRILTTTQILAILERKGTFCVDRYTYRAHNLRGKLHKLVKKKTLTLQGRTRQELIYILTPEPPQCQK